MTTTAIALKTAIQNTVKTALLDFAGFGSQNVDQDLAVEEQLKFVWFGFELYPDDYNQGAGVRIAIANKQVESYETSLSDGKKETIVTYNLQIVGCTRPVATAQNELGDTEAALLEEIIEQRLPVWNFGTAASQSQALRGGRSARVTSIRYVTSEFEQVTDAKVNKIIFRMLFHLQAQVLSSPRS